MVSWWITVLDLLRAMKIYLSQMTQRSFPYSSLAHLCTSIYVCLLQVEEPPKILNLINHNSCFILNYLIEEIVRFLFLV